MHLGNEFHPDDHAAPVRKHEQEVERIHNRPGEAGCHPMVTDCAYIQKGLVYVLRILRIYVCMYVCMYVN